MKERANKEAGVEDQERVNTLERGKYQRKQYWDWGYGAHPNALALTGRKPISLDDMMKKKKKHEYRIFLCL